MANLSPVLAVAATRSVKTRTLLRRFYFLVCLVPYAISRLWKRVVSWGWQQAVKGRFATIGAHCRIRGTSLITGAERIVIGDNVHIGDNATIRGDGGLRIGSHTHISRNIVIYTVNHNYEGKRLPFDETVVEKPVDIGEAVWIGINVIILPGVEVGEGAVIGAGSVVARSIPPLAIAGGNPCRVLKYRDAEHFQSLKTAGCFGGVNGNSVSGYS
jgi:acetyltransferase-like isoleucine patch superfamily enzyme